jgi:hypothetical protein
MHSRQRRIRPYELPVGFLPEEGDLSAMHHVERILHNARGIGGCLVGGKTGCHEDDTMDEVTGGEAREVGQKRGTARTPAFTPLVVCGSGRRASHGHVPSLTGVPFPYRYASPSICTKVSTAPSLNQSTSSLGIVDTVQWLLTSRLQQTGHWRSSW